MRKWLIGALLAATAAVPTLAQAQDGERRGRGGERSDEARAERREARQAQRAERQQASPEQRAERQAERQQNRIERQQQRVEPVAQPRVEAPRVRAEAQADFGARRDGNAAARQRLREQLRDDPVAARRTWRNAEQAAPAVRADRDDRQRGDRVRRDRDDGVQWSRNDRDDRRWNDRQRNDRQWNDRQRIDRQWDHRGGGWDRQANRSWNRDWRRDGRYDWNGYRSNNRNAFRLPRYYAPYGWNYGYRRFSVGALLSQVLWSQSYWIDDPYEYRLPEAYGPYRWVRYYNDALLVDIRSGQVIDTVYGMFY